MALVTERFEKKKNSLEQSEYVSRSFHAVCLYYVSKHFYSALKSRCHWR